MQVFYNSRLARENELYSPYDLTKKPIINAKCSEKCSLIMYDPDAVGGTFVHWVVGDYFGKKQEVLPYYGPHPPQGSGIHRYIFALYPNLSFDIKTREIPNIKTFVGDQKPLKTFQIKSTFVTMGGKNKSKKKNKKKKRRKTCRKLH